MLFFWFLSWFNCSWSEWLGWCRTSADRGWIPRSWIMISMIYISLIKMFSMIWEGSSVMTLVGKIIILHRRSLGLVLFRFLFILLDLMNICHDSFDQVLHSWGILFIWILGCYSWYIQVTLGAIFTYIKLPPWQLAWVLFLRIWSPMPMWSSCHLMWGLSSFSFPILIPYSINHFLAWVRGIILMTYWGWSCCWGFILV